MLMHLDHSKQNILVFLSILVVTFDAHMIELLERFQQNTTLRFGIKTSVDDVYLNLKLTQVFPDYKYECVVAPVDSKDRNFMWRWCATSMPFLVTCDNSRIQDYAMIISNPENIELNIYAIAVYIDINSDINGYVHHGTEEISSFNGNDHITVVKSAVSISLSDANNGTANYHHVRNQDIEHCPVSLENKYIFVQTHENWYDARDYCQNVYGTHLATITTDEEVLYVLEIMKGRLNTNRIWIGLNDIEQQGVWVWSDGTKCDSYVNGSGLCIHDPHWSPGEPNNLDNEDCAEFGFGDSGNINDDNCWEKLMFVCNMNQNVTASIFVAEVDEQQLAKWIMVMIALSVVICVLFGLIVGFVAYYCKTKKQFKTVEIKLDKVESEKECLKEKLENVQAELSVVSATVFAFSHKDASKEHKVTPPPNELDEGNQTCVASNQINKD